MTRKVQVIISLTLALALGAGAAQAQLNEKALLLNTREFGDFREAKQKKDKGKVTLKVWEPYREFLQKGRLWSNP